MIWLFLNSQKNLKKNLKDYKMLEILAIIFFSKKIRTIAEEKNIPAKKWIIRLIVVWFSIEFAIAVAGVVLFGEESILIIGLLALGMGVLSGFVTLNELKKQETLDDEIEYLGKREDKFDHFR